MNIVNLYKDSFSVYIGRGGHNPAFGNPFRITNASDMERIRVVDEFEKFARANKVMLQKINELPEDATLGCFCAPRLCHGHVIKRLWQEMHGLKYRAPKRLVSVMYTLNQGDVDAEP